MPLNQRTIENLAFELYDPPIYLKSNCHMEITESHLSQEGSFSGTEKNSDRVNSLLRLFDFDPTNQKMALEILRQAYGDEHWSLVAEFFHIHSKLMSESSEALALAGHALLNLGTTPEAQLLLNQAVALGNNDNSVLFNAAYANFLNGNLTQALSAIESIDVTYEYFPLVVLLKSRILYYSGKTDEALTLLESVETLGTPDYLGFKALLIQDGEQANADKVFLFARQALSDAPHNQDALLALASLHLERIELNEAVPYLNRLLEQSPNHGRALSGAGQVAFHAFEFERALPLFQQAVQHMDNHIGTWHLKAWTEILTGLIDEAFLSMQKAYDLDRNFAETHGGLASVYALQGELALAEKHIKIADRIDNSGLASVFAKMVLLNKTGKHQESTDLFERITSQKHKRLNITPSEVISQRIRELSAPKTQH